MATSKPGYCGGATGCTEKHPVEKLPVGYYWNDIVQYRGTHHGNDYIYEVWMVDNNDDDDE